MAGQIKTVTTTINGQSYTLTYNATSGLYEGTIIAPKKSSYSETNHESDVNVANNINRNYGVDGLSLNVSFTKKE